MMPDQSVIVPELHGRQSGASRRQRTDQIATINQYYDQAMFRDYPRATHEFNNYGYWEPGILTHQQACENLLEILLAYIPSKDGQILDVACGKGATTRYLLNYYRPWNVTGVNISRKQLQRCRQNASGCRFLLMDATTMSFSDDTFDNIICVEAAFHFNTRKKFLQEAYRVLRPGGCLLLSDVLATKESESTRPGRTAENFVAGPGEYRSILARAGFERIRVKDATRNCWQPFLSHAIRGWRRSFRDGFLTWQLLQRRERELSVKDRRIRYYVLACGQKPG